jgi:hypothetical protein
MTQVKALVWNILDCCQDGFKHHSAVYEKYSSPKFKKASTFVEGEIKKGFQLPMQPTQGLLRCSQVAEEMSFLGQSADFCHVSN